MHSYVVLLAVMAPGMYCQTLVSELSDGQPELPATPMNEKTSARNPAASTQTVYATVPKPGEHTSQGASHGSSVSKCLESETHKAFSMSYAGTPFPMSSPAASMETYPASSSESPVQTHTISPPKTPAQSYSSSTLAASVQSYLASSSPVVSSPAGYSTATAASIGSSSYPIAPPVANTTISTVPPTASASKTYPMASTNVASGMANGLQPALCLGLAGLIVVKLV